MKLMTLLDISGSIGADNQDVNLALCKAKRNGKRGRADLYEIGDAEIQTLRDYYTRRHKRNVAAMEKTARILRLLEEMAGHMDAEEP